MLKGKGKIKTMEEILAALKKANSEATTTANLISGAKSSEPILLQCSRTVIAIHAIPILSITNQTAPRCTYTELLEAESAIDPLIARWKRIQLACIIAVSVLHLYETGWLSENLEMADFLFFGTANSHYHLHSCMAPYISPKDPKPHMQTPFECLKGAGDPQTYLGARDQRLATLFHRLGIVLFELGRGMDYRTIAAMSNEEYAGLKPEDIEMLRKSKVIQEIEKIPFGRSYADLVKFCLTGRLYATSLIDFDRRFNEAVVEKLGRLEMHFSAILEDE
ncbi:unnamed protein product [Periconia digitata]|uniref:Uncharacterized protein n=1 Tax=Periconia digitata TaxID=1303443 RepID=A0A9W4UNH7_9PLEO|nr:unnamed protein product [Periconia digitata]